MSKSKTLYISDLDGTLLNNSAELSGYTVNTLNSLIAKGMDFSVATARTLASTAKILSGVAINLPIILMNGVLIYDIAQKEYIIVNSLSPETVKTIIKILRQFETTGFMYKLNCSELITYHESLEQKPLRDFVEERIRRYYKSFKHTEGFENITPDNVIYFTLMDTYERLEPVYHAIKSQNSLKPTMYEDTYKPGYWYLEIFSEKASKQNAVEYLRKRYGYEKIIGFGDNLNDLPLFAACDEGYAVANARNELKEKAAAVIDANIDDGVAKWLAENVLI